MFLGHFNAICLYGKFAKLFKKQMSEICVQQICNKRRNLKLDSDRGKA